MPSYRKPNMGKFNSAMNKLKAENRKFQQETNKVIRDLKAIERKSQNELRKIQSSAPRKIIVSPRSQPQNVERIYDALYENPNLQYVSEEIRDVFISHASDDKSSFVQPLVDEMTARGITRWYDKEQSVNMWGRSLREELDNGIRLSKFSLVVFSQNYFKKYWTKRELDGILLKEQIDNGQILPIWYGIDVNDMYQFSPMLSGMMSFSTDIYSIAEICDALESKIRSSATQAT